MPAEKKQSVFLSLILLLLVACMVLHFRAYNYASSIRFFYFFSCLTIFILLYKNYEDCALLPAVDCEKLQNKGLYGCGNVVKRLFWGLKLRL